MKRYIDGFLRAFFKVAKRVILSNKTLSNAAMDVYNIEEFDNIFEHEKMLADRSRVDSYKKAIFKHIRPDDTVIDLGTGSGILSFFAAQNRAKKIYAIDHGNIIDLAKKISELNGFNNIVFEKVNSRAFNPPEKIDLILHEQIGDDLFDENMIENILDLKKRVLKEGGRILPGKFELYLEPVSLKPEYRVPYIWEQNLFGIEFSSLKDDPLTERFKSGDHHMMYIAPNSVDFLLCEPQPVLSFDMNDDNLQISYHIKPQTRRVVRQGIMDGVCLYFKIIFDEEISFTTIPLNVERCYSWSNRFFRTERTLYHFNDLISFNVMMDNPLIANTWSLEFNHETEKEKFKRKHLQVS